ncbi:MAG TPA: PAS domain S-box protein, partial [Polyangiaceae bacterium]|nr:PAS domain S-box protein [Polyangiaceae bacterium]
MPSSAPSLLPILERALNSGLSFQSAFSDFPLAVTVMDADARVLFLNTAAETLFGWSAAEVLGNVSPLAPDELVEQSRHILGQIFAGETIRGIETTRIHKNGTRVPVELWAVPLRDANGAIHASLGVLLDLTERRRTLRDHQYLLQHLHDAVLLYDAETEIVLEANRRACEL